MLDKLQKIWHRFTEWRRKAKYIEFPISLVTYTHITMILMTFHLHGTMKTLFYTFFHKTAKEGIFLLGMCLVGAAVGWGLSIFILDVLHISPFYQPSVDVSELTVNCIKANPTLDIEQLAEQLDKEIVEVKTQDKKYFHKSLTVWAGATVAVLGVFFYVIFKNKIL